MLAILSLFLPLSFAGKPLPPAVRNKLVEECETKQKGVSCVTLADETLCGMGYNKDYAQFMTKACHVFQVNCQKGVAKACENYSKCLIDCSPRIEDVYLSYTLSATGVKHCFLKDREQGEPLREGRALLEQACDKSSIVGCIGTAIILAEIEPKTVDEQLSLLGMACDLEDAEGCIRLVDTLQKVENKEQERSQARDKACALGVKDYCKSGE